jgi:O-antigen/teichoic acid export membrane protein
MQSSPTLQPAHLVPTSSVSARFFGYLTADGLNYLLGFAIYGWLIRILSDRQYGYLSVATSIYQVLMMVTALGIDLTGPRLISDAGGNPAHIALQAQRIRIAAALFVCAPITAILSVAYWRLGQHDVAWVILAGFSMVLARALDLTFMAVALDAPGALARTRAFGLGLFLISLFACKGIISRGVWLVPVLNAAGITIGRIQLMRILRRKAAQRISPIGQHLDTGYIVRQGAKAGSGQLLLFILQGMDVVLLARYSSNEAVGQYAMASRLYLFGTAVLACLLNTYMPALIAVAHNPTSLSRLFRRFLLTSAGIGLVGCAAFWIAAPAVCELLGHRQLSIVRQISPLFAILFLVMAICNPFLSFLPSLHRSGTYLIGITAALVLLLATDLVLMPRLGPTGAALGQLIATTFMAAFMARAFQLHLAGLRDQPAVLVASA